MCACRLRFKAQTMSESENTFTARDARIDTAEIEAGNTFSPRFSADGLIVAVVTDADDGRLLMVAHMNAEALNATIRTGIAHYWSRSRGKLWRKGESSGHEQKVREIRTDCDQDVIQLLVKTGSTGANCHTGRRSCFYRVVSFETSGKARLVFDGNDEPRFDPSKVYSG